MFPFAVGSGSSRTRVIVVVVVVVVVVVPVTVAVFLFLQLANPCAAHSTSLQAVKKDLGKARRGARTSCS